MCVHKDIHDSFKNNLNLERLFFITFLIARTLSDTHI